MGFQADDRKNYLAAGQETRTLISLTRTSILKRSPFKSLLRKTLNHAVCKKPTIPNAKLKDFPLRLICAILEVFPATPVRNGRVQAEAIMPKNAIPLLP